MQKGDLYAVLAAIPRGVDPQLQQYYENAIDRKKKRKDRPKVINSLDDLSALHMSILLPNSNHSRELLPMGCDVEAKDADNNTPLHTAALYDGTNLLGVFDLLVWKADYNALTKGGSTAFDLAMATNNYAVAFLIYIFSHGRERIKARKVYFARFEELLNHQESRKHISKFFDEAFFSAMKKYLNLAAFGPELEQARKILHERFSQFNEALRISHSDDIPKAFYEDIPIKEIHKIHLTDGLTSLIKNFLQALKTKRFDIDSSMESKDENDIVTAASLKTEKKSQSQSEGESTSVIAMQATKPVGEKTSGAAAQAAEEEKRDGVKAKTKNDDAVNYRFLASITGRFQRLWFSIGRSEEADGCSIEQHSTNAAVDEHSAINNSQQNAIRQIPAEELDIYRMSWYF